MTSTVEIRKTRTGYADVLIDGKVRAKATTAGRSGWFVHLPNGAPAYRGRPGKRMRRAIESAEKVLD